MEEIERKVERLEYEHTAIKQKQNQCSDALNSIKMSYVSLEKNIEKLTEIVQNISKIENDLNILKVEVSHKQDIIDSKLKGTKELTDKDIKDIKDDLAEIYALIKKVVWALVSGLIGGVGYLILKVVGVA